MKRYLSCIMVVLMLATTTAPIFAASSSYTDTKTSDWFYGSLDTLSTNNIITGYPDGSFKPSNILNIDQYITILCRLTDNDVGIANGYWAQNYIDYASSAGWLDGMTINQYNVPINRLQASKLTVKAMGYNSSLPADELAQYEVYISDYRSIPPSYRNDVLLNYAIGLTNGYPDGSFKGSNTLTRAEAAVISHRVFDESVRKLLLSPEKTKQVLAIFDMDNMEAFAPLEPDITMPMGMMLFAIPSAPAPLPIPSLPLAPPVAVITENVIADTLIEMSDLETSNKVAAGYAYGSLNVNLLTETDDSILIITAEDGSYTITIDLLLMIDSEGNLRPDASDIIRIVCENIDTINAPNMHAFILGHFAKRLEIPAEGAFGYFGSTEILMTNLTMDHNVTKVQFKISE